MDLMKRCILISICMCLIICSFFNILNIYRIRSLNDKYLNSIPESSSSSVTPEFYKSRTLCVTAVSLLAVNSEAEYNSLKQNNLIEPAVSSKYLLSSFNKYTVDFKYPPRIDIYDILVDKEKLGDGVSFVNIERYDNQGVVHKELYKISCRNNTVVGMHKMGDLK